MGFKYASEYKLYKKETDYQNKINQEQDKLDYQYWTKQQTQLNKWNQESAQKQMDFQKMMSDTAHQREVKDLQLAGLNPVLSANNGASTASGAYANIDSAPVSAMSQSKIANRQIGANIRMNNDTLANNYKIARYQAQMNAAVQKYVANMQYQLGLQQAQLAYQAQVDTTQMNINNPNTLIGAVREVGKAIFGDGSNGSGSGTSAKGQSTGSSKYITGSSSNNPVMNFVNGITSAMYGSSAKSNPKTGQSIKWTGNNSLSASAKKALQTLIKNSNVSKKAYLHAMEQFSRGNWDFDSDQWRYDHGYKFNRPWHPNK